MKLTVRANCGLRLGRKDERRLLQKSELLRDAAVGPVSFRRQARNIELGEGGHHLPDG
jgi:hypothetical protein